ncbi:MAG: antitoxin family protein [Vicinamibacteria bacterium]|jgi:predicted DNA-binding antitoxin AbrB/MazE fold protein|nr:antitoxin family protein [Vicinamibacteria bacterium]
MTIAVDAIYENGMLKLKSPVGLPEKAQVHVTIETSEDARTPLGKKLQTLRARVLDSGVTPLDWDGISEEVASHRGGWRESK